MKVDQNLQRSAKSSVTDETPQPALPKDHPASICILRLSALGDVTHVLPLINRLNKVWPDAKVTWIIGAFEHKLVCDLPNVEFITLNKKSGWRGLKKLREQ